MSSKIGLLLVNLGSPDSPTAKDVRKYLFEFLHDYRVIDINRFIWCPILHGSIVDENGCSPPKVLSQLIEEARALLLVSDIDVEVTNIRALWKLLQEVFMVYRLFDIHNRH